MSTTGVSIDYLTAGANRQAAGADWSRSGLLAFGADVNVALWQPDLRSPTGIARLLSGHKGTVKAVKFLEADGDEATYLVTGSDDGTLVVWKSTAGQLDFDAHQTCVGHAGAVNCIAEVRLSSSPPRWVIATGAADATICTWSFEPGQLLLRHTVQTAPKYFPLALALTTLDGAPAALVLAAAGTRDTIQIWTANAVASEDLTFSFQATLVGHEGWIRSLTFARQATETGEAGHNLLLASASQDKYVRIWRVHEGPDLPALTASATDASDHAFLPAKSPSNKAYWLKAAGRDFSVTFEALLLGHDDWIYSARWHAHPDGRLQLLSTSADNSLAIWEADPSSGIWVSTVRLGDSSREQGATTATGSTGGFWTGLWSPDGKAVACLGRTGGWRIWRCHSVHGGWRPSVAVSGHTKAVTGIAWSKTGSYLLSTSSDQTTRLHAAESHLGGGPCHEMSRPQIHGYDLNCIDSLGEQQFVSGADEKLMRVFSMPKAVATLLGRPVVVDETNAEHMADAANMPVLGLSNKAIDAVDDAQTQPVRGGDEAADLVSVVGKSCLDLRQPPLEDTLSRYTLWPEMEKLYGHGYEISCLAASHDGTLVASACKASSTNHAVIRLFETQRWTEVRPPLTAHYLTVTRLRFSADDRLLLSVGRDRQWAVFERDPDGPATFRLLQLQAKGHSRMILDAAWAPSETPVFATAGRDKHIRIWTSTSGNGGSHRQFIQTAALSCTAPVTAVDFLSCRLGGLLVLAIGTEAGRLSVCLVDDGNNSLAQCELSSRAELTFPGAVLQLAWKPCPSDLSPSACRSYTLAAAGDDSSLRLFTLDKDYLRSAGPSRGRH